MEVIDLSHTINSGMPVFPGTEPMLLERAFSIEKDGFAESRLTMFSHVGTHMDAPCHMIINGRSLDSFPVSQFVGKALVMDCSNMDEINGTRIIQLEAIEKYEKQMADVEFVIIYTGWSKLWGSDKYYEDFPSLSAEAAKWLVSYPLKGVGIDAISIDDMKTKTFPIHQIIMNSGLVIIENLTNLESILNKRVTFNALPLKFEASDGAPVRAIAIIDG